MKEILDLISRMEFSMEQFFTDKLNKPQLAGYAGFFAWLVFFLAVLLAFVLVSMGVHAVKTFFACSVRVKLNKTNPIKFRFLQEAGTLAIKYRYEKAGKKFSRRRDYTKPDVQKEINEACMDMASLIIKGDRWSDMFTSWYNVHGPVSRKKFPQTAADFYRYKKESVSR